MRWVGHVACIGKIRNAYNILVGKLEGKRPHRRPQQRWKDVNINLMETGQEGVEWMHLPQDRDQ
jgi:hypothetical protein